VRAGSKGKSHLVSSGIVLANDENFIARDVSVGDDTAGLGARKADREKTTTSDLQHSKMKEINYTI